MSAISYDDVGQDLRRIIISGRLDSPGAHSIAARLLELAEAPKRAVVVDLSDVQFLASTGLGALIASAKAVHGRGGKLVLVVNGSSVMMSLEATGVDKFIPVFRTVPDAERAALA
jgi:anti-anti-sigma factor